MALQFANEEKAIPVIEDKEFRIEICEEGFMAAGLPKPDPGPG